MAVPESKRRANDRYDKANARQKIVKFYPPDHDLVEWCDRCGEPFATYVKRLIREDMERREESAD